MGNIPQGRKESDVTEVTEHTNPISFVKILYILPVLDQMNLLHEDYPRGSDLSSSESLGLG